MTDVGAEAKPWHEVIVETISGTNLKDKEQVNKMVEVVDSALSASRVADEMRLPEIDGRRPDALVTPTGEFTGRFVAGGKPRISIKPGRAGIRPT